MLASLENYVCSGNFVGLKSFSWNRLSGLRSQAEKSVTYTYSLSFSHSRSEFHPNTA